MKQETPSKISPFDIIKSVSSTKKHILTDPKEYTAYVVNKGLSYFPDTIGFANEMNRLWAIPPEHQYDYYMNAIRKRDRYSKWNKKDKETEKTLENIMEYYNCSTRVAKQYMKGMSESDIEFINNIMATRQ